MDRSGLQRIIPVILVLIIVIVAVAALFSLGRTLFSGGNEDPVQPVDTGNQLTSSLADRSVQMTVRGPIVAQENYHTYTIKISPDTRNMTTYVGYLKDPVDSEQLENNKQAYEQFVYALDREGLLEGETLEGDAGETRGICPDGALYIFSILKGNDTVEQRWTTTCESARGSLRAARSQVVDLFRDQIPNYNKLVSKIRFNY